MSESRRIERIVASTPVNRTAAVVAQGSNQDIPLTERQLRENLRTAIWRLDEQIKTASRKDKKALGKIKCDIQEKLRVLGRPKKRRPTYGGNFVEAARATLPPALFRTLCEMADKMCRDDETKYGVAEGELAT